eukprot:TRINITY_DN11584_c0_g1_i5.p1 TRINITY_DN11584_c0_g1~~TRINITY_DN11584_c0_g1_i5.p1  ORF type:complete len:155 (+),score=40.88 TRINITY_DN11584_c0_g1_i5:117-581(+)
MANRTQPVGGARVENDDGPVEGGQCRPSELWQGPNLPGVIQQWVMPDFKAVWRSGSVCIRLRDVLRENKELMLRCEGLKCREEAEERARRGEVWISPELRDIFQDYFTRYDLRGDAVYYDCLLYTSDAADEEDSVDLGGRRIIKKKKKKRKEQG